IRSRRRSSSSTTSIRRWKRRPRCSLNKVVRRRTASHDAVYRRCHGSGSDMNALRIKQIVLGALGVLALLALQPAMAAGLTGAQVLDGFRELGGYVLSP